LRKSNLQLTLTKLYISERFFPNQQNFSASYFQAIKIFVIAKKNTEGEISMKKFLALSLLLGSVIFTVSTAEAKTTSENSKNAIEISAAQQGRYYQNRRYNNHRSVRIVTRNVRRGRQIYRETYRVTYNNRNGRTRTQLISRVRIR